jgi:hypothetical protein
MAYTVYQLATLANAVYNGATSVVGDWRLSDRFGQDRGGGFFGGVYRSGMLTVLAMRGTNDEYDIAPDAQVAFGEVPCQLSHAEVAWQRTMSMTPSSRVVLTGHSLGGALACLIAAKSGLPCVTFNAPGVARSYAASFRMPLVKPGAMPVTPPTGPGLVAGVVALATVETSKIINIRASGDVVSLGTGPRLGRVDTISVTGCRAIEVAQRKATVADVVMSPDYVVTQGLSITSEVAAKAVSYVLCQHGMELMMQALKNMSEYNRDLGW